MNPMRMILFVFMLWAGSVFASDTLLTPAPIELGGHLPAPYNCLWYSGGSDEVITLYAFGCSARPSVMFVYVKTDSKSMNDYPFVWNGVTLVLKGTGAGKNQMNLYRRQ